MDFFYYNISINLPVVKFCSNFIIVCELHLISFLRRTNLKLVYNGSSEEGIVQEGAHLFILEPEVPVLEPTLQLTGCGILGD